MASLLRAAKAQVKLLMFANHQTVANHVAQTRTELGQFLDQFRLTQSHLDLVVCLEREMRESPVEGGQEARGR